MREVVRYSEAFKLRLVEDIGEGKYQSLEEARRRNGICGASTLNQWLKQYGREDMLPKRIKVETMTERDELQEARKRIRELEAALADAHMEYCLESAFLDIACERLGTSTEELKKKNGITVAGARKRRGMA
ncbi:MAG: transposase, partial [Treponema sp.]|nr:transposase [Treponema sp.]